MIRVFPRRTKWTPDDVLAFVGDPPFQFHKLSVSEVYVSVTFTWDIEEGKRLAHEWGAYYPNIHIGGPAFDMKGGEFFPGLFIKQGVTITSRGCPWKCSWCFVPKREGRIRELPIRDGWIVQDNNLLACSKEHIEAVFEMLRRQKKAIKFSGGLDTQLFKPWHIDLLKTIKLNEAWFACDRIENEKHLQKTADLMSDFSINKKRCYVLIGYWGESILTAEARLERIYEMGFLPFAQLYRDGDNSQMWSREWRALARKWSRPAVYRSPKRLAKEEP